MNEQTQTDNIILDSEIEDESDVVKALSHLLKAFIGNNPPWSPVVDGSIVEPVTDPARLLEAGHAILPKGTELTPGRELAFDLPITIMRD